MNSPEDELIFKKATLALGGVVRLPKGFTVPVRVSRSTAGPGAGSDSAVFTFHGMRVKKSVSYDEGEFELVVSDDGTLSLRHHGEDFIDDVGFEPVVHHCPEQAFVTIDSRCAYRCAFCASPRLPPEDLKVRTDDEIARMCLEARAEAIALTSGVFDGDVQAQVDRFVSIIGRIRSEDTSTPIGIEPYVETEDQVRALKEAGADEIKLNVQAATDEIFEKVCPDMNRERTFECLGHAVKYFGRGNVSSNIIFGMGETTDELERCMDRLCRMDVIPTVRALRRNRYNRESLDAALGPDSSMKVTPAYMVKVAEIHKSILLRYGFDAESSRTMCLRCTCCDLIPGRDL